MSDPYYDVGYHSTHYKSLITDDEYFHARAEVQVRTYFNAERRRRRIFEYGCGVGHGIAALPNAAGWDISSEALRSCKQRGLNVFQNIDVVPRRAWDIVFCRHVLEHLERPLDALRTMSELATTSGELCLIVPMEDHRKPAVIASDQDQHLYSWNFRCINNLLFRAGWTPISNDILYMLGWKRFLPARRLFGPEIYYRISKLGGILRRNGELIIWARRT